MARKSKSFQTINYKVVGPSGDLRHVSVPSFMGDCHDVCKRLPHFIVFMYLRKSSTCYAQTALSSDESLVEGPANIYCNAEGQRIAVPQMPVSGDHAYHIWKEYVAPRRQAA
jgi:hypothetical protein